MPDTLIRAKNKCSFAVTVIILVSKKRKLWVGEVKCGVFG